MTRCDECTTRHFHFVQLCVFPTQSMTLSSLDLRLELSKRQLRHAALYMQISLLKFLDLNFFLFF